MDDPTLLSVVINWFPLFVYLAVMVYIARSFNRYARDRASFHKGALDHMQRQTQAVEQIAAEFARREASK